jgi:hypothetical protein
VHRSLFQKEPSYNSYIFQCLVPICYHFEIIRLIKYPTNMTKHQWDTISDMVIMRDVNVKYIKNFIHCPLVKLRFMFIVR